MNNKVESLGSFWESTAPFVDMAKKDLIREEQARLKRRLGYVPMMDNARDDLSYEEMEKAYEKVEDVLDEMEEVKKILNKADISLKLFPFKPQMNKQGEIVGFVPKGKNDKEIKEDIQKYKEEMEKALEQGKITQAEFDKLNENLEHLMEENEIELDDDLEFELSNDEIENELEKLVIHNFGNEREFEKLCQEYKDYDLDERKNCLEDFNSKINQQLGIAGNLKFTSNPNMKFENSFTDKGFYLTEKQVETQDLKPILYTMMEKAKIREFEIKNQQKISIQQKKEMHKKIMEERERKYKKQKEQDDRKNAQKTMQRMRNMWNG